MRKLLWLALAGVMVYGICGSAPSASSLKHAFNVEVVAIPGVTDFTQDKDVLKFKYASVIYEVAIISATVEETSYSDYPYSGYIEAKFKEEGQLLERLDLLARRDIDPDNIVAFWDLEMKKWSWNVYIEEPVEEDY